MKVDVEKQGSVTVIIPRDALTESSVAYLRDAVTETLRNRAARIVYDLCHVPYVDSAGIECMLALVDQGGGPLQPRVASMNETVREALIVTDVIKRMSTYDSVESAVRSYR